MSLVISRCSIFFFASSAVVCFWYRCHFFVCFNYAFSDGLVSLLCCFFIVLISLLLLAWWIFSAAIFMFQFRFLLLPCLSSLFLLYCLKFAVAAFLVVIGFCSFFGFDLAFSSVLAACYISLRHFFEFRFL